MQCLIDFASLLADSNATVVVFECALCFHSMPSIISNNNNEDKKY